MKHGRLTLRVISHTCQYGLGDSVDHSGDEGVSLIVPVVGLAEVSDFLFSVELPSRTENRFWLMIIKTCVISILLLNPNISLMGEKSMRKLGFQWAKYQLSAVPMTTKVIVCIARPQ